MNFLMLWCHQATSHNLRQCWPRSRKSFYLDWNLFRRAQLPICKGDCHEQSIPWPFSQLMSTKIYICLPCDITRPQWVNSSYQSLFVEKWHYVLSGDLTFIIQASNPLMATARTTLVFCIPDKVTTAINVLINVTTVTSMCSCVTKLGNIGITFVVLVLFMLLLRVNSYCPP